MDSVILILSYSDDALEEEVMIEIDGEKCHLCRECVNVCHTGCMSVTGGRLRNDYHLCSTCCQCVAVCPTGALTWDGLESRKLEPEKAVSYEQLLHLLEARRATRGFNDTPVEREKLEKICRTVKLAPSNIYDLEVVLISDWKIIEELERISSEGVCRMNRWFFNNPWVFKPLQALSPQAVSDIDKRKTERIIGRGGSSLRGAPVVIMLTGNPWIGYSETSANYALCNMILTAQTLELGSVVSGSGLIFFSRSGRVLRMLGIPRDRRILAILEVGCPDVRFRRSVEGNYPAVHLFE
ncbi:MAG: nitroreductase family protein [Actinomycetota bacterium]|nr:nitroreductase family protein [Actinomycetota bacterium]